MNLACLIYVHKKESPAFNLTELMGGGSLMLIHSFPPNRVGSFGNWLIRDRVIAKSHCNQIDNCIILRMHAYTSPTHGRTQSLLEAMNSFEKGNGVRVL